MMHTLLSQPWLAHLGLLSLLLWLIAIGLGLSIVMRRITGLQRLQAFHSKNISNTCRQMVVLNRKIQGLEQTQGQEDSLPLQKHLPENSVYQSAIQLLQSGHTIEEVIQRCHLSYGEAALIQSLQQK